MCNVCVFYEIILSNKFDLFEATCFIKQNNLFWVRQGKHLLSLKFQPRFQKY